MTWGVLNAAMLVGLLGAALPVVIHFLNRRRDPVIAWGAMQFLDLGRRARQKLRLTELLLMLARVGLLAAVALALARPFLAPSAPARATGGGLGGVVGLTAPARDVVLILDQSASMDRANGPAGETPRKQAIAWARRFVAALGPGDSVAILAAGDRVRPVVDPPSFDKARVVEALAKLEATPARGGSDVPAALAEAFRVLEGTQNPAREVVILTDGQRVAWRPGDPARWSLMRDLQKRLPVAPRIWSTTFGPATPDPDDPLDAALGNIQLSRTLVTPGLPVEVKAELTNAGPGSLTTNVELLLDGRALPGTSQSVGPIPVGGRAPLAFRTTIASAGSHLLTVQRAGGDDPLPANDRVSAAITAAPALEVLLVDGAPGREPFRGPTDFLRAALTPSGDDTPQAHARVVRFDRLQAADLKDPQVVILANVEKLPADITAALAGFIENGGGVFVVPGDRTDPNAYRSLAWMPATLGDWSGSLAARKVVAHPSPSSFSGPVLPPFGQGEAPALAAAGLFAYRKLTPAAGAFVAARLDTGDPWVVERPQGRGRALVIAGTLDADGGTLPVNPDFLPLLHEWVMHLAGGSEPRAVRAGEPLVFDLGPDAAPATKRDAPVVHTPSGHVGKAAIARAGGRIQARFDETVEAGAYRLELPDPPGGSAWATVLDDGRESESARLEPAEAARLTEGWPLVMENDPTRLAGRMLDTDTPASRREVWRGLIVLALAGLCVEVYLTRKLVRGQGLALDSGVT